MGILVYRCVAAHDDPGVEPEIGDEALGSGRSTSRLCTETCSHVLDSTRWEGHASGKNKQK
jgi:hypothetical protein